MPIYVFDGERMVDKSTGNPMVTGPSGPVPCPRVLSDMEGYRSPIDGSWIEGRRARRYDLEKNGCVDANDLRTKKTFRNERFIKKHGLKQE
jgi:hypothetical protein